MQDDNETNQSIKKQIQIQSVQGEMYWYNEVVISLQSNQMNQTNVVLNLNPPSTFFNLSISKPTIYFFLAGTLQTIGVNRRLVDISDNLIALCVKK